MLKNKYHEFSIMKSHIIFYQISELHFLQCKQVIRFCIKLPSKSSVQVIRFCIKLPSKHSITHIFQIPYPKEIVVQRATLDLSYQIGICLVFSLELHKFPKLLEVGFSLSCCSNVSIIASGRLRHIPRQLDVLCDVSSCTLPRQVTPITVYHRVSSHYRNRRDTLEYSK